MIVHINEKEIHLNNKDVMASKKIVSKFLKTIENASRRSNNVAFYITVLIVMHMMSQELLDCLPPEDLKKFMSVFEK